MVFGKSVLLCYKPPCVYHFLLNFVAFFFFKGGKNVLPYCEQYPWANVLYGELLNIDRIKE